MPAFPEFATLRLGTSYEDASVVERSEVERGPAKTRRTSSDPMVTATGTLQFSRREDIAAFRAWFYSAAGANAGAAWVDWTDPRTGTLRSIRFVSMGALTPLSGRFALAQQPVVFEYLETVEEIDGLAPMRWDFDSGPEGWGSAGGLGNVTWLPGKLRLSVSSGYLATRRIDLAFPGRYKRVVRASVTRIAGSGADWHGNLYFWIPSRPGDTGGARKTIPHLLPSVGASAVLAWDMSQLTEGGTEWLDNTIIGLTVDLSGGAEDVFHIDWISVESA